MMLLTILFLFSVSVAVGMLTVDLGFGGPDLLKDRYGA